jgi:leader peptidase (prepilin peptidase) / N-methyltransferase
MAPLVASIYAFAFGAVIGSFLNVIIYRLPRGESIAFPASHCPDCGARIRPWHNIPILGYIALLGRCYDCRKPISLRYPLNELANATFYVAVLQRTGISTGFVLISAIVSMTIVLIHIDAEVQLLPDVIDVPGAVIGVLASIVGVGALAPDLMLARTVAESLIGAAVGAGVLLAIALLYQLVRKIEGMGLGDVKMMAMIGGVTGWRPLLPILTLASIAGALTGIVIMIVSRRADLKFALPFGVFLGLAFLTMLFFGELLFAWVPALRFGA